MWPPTVRGISQLLSRSMAAATASPQVWAPFTMRGVPVGFGMASVTARSGVRQESGVVDEEDCEICSLLLQLLFQRDIFRLEYLLEDPLPASLALWAVASPVSS